MWWWFHLEPVSYWVLTQALLAVLVTSSDVQRYTCVGSSHLWFQPSWCWTNNSEKINVSIISRHRFPRSNSLTPCTSCTRCVLGAILWHFSERKHVYYKSCCSMVCASLAIITILYLLIYLCLLMFILFLYFTIIETPGFSLNNPGSTSYGWILNPFRHIVH